MAEAPSPAPARRRRQLYLPRVELCLLDPEDLDQPLDDAEDLPTVLHVSFGLRQSDLEGGLWTG